MADQDCQPREDATSAASTSQVPGAALSKKAARLLHRKVKVNKHALYRGRMLTRIVAEPAACAGGCQRWQGFIRRTELRRQTGQFDTNKYLRNTRTERKVIEHPIRTSHLVAGPLFQQSVFTCRRHQKEMGQVLIPAAHRTSCELEVGARAHTQIQPLSSFQNLVIAFCRPCLTKLKDSTSCFSNEPECKSAEVVTEVEILNIYCSNQPD